MSNLQSGPSMHYLHQRLLAYPAGLAPAGQSLIALLNDLLVRLEPAVTTATLLPIYSLPLWDDPEGHDRADTLLLMVWLLADDAFCELTLYADEIISLLASSNQLMDTTHPNLDDEDQREELIRLTLNGLRLKPQNETDQQAQDRLLMVSSSERARVVAASRAAEERAEAIRKALAEKRAREAADKYTRE